MTRPLETEFKSFEIAPFFELLFARRSLAPRLGYLTLKLFEFNL